MQNKTFGPARKSALEARFDAQRIAFGPVVFQAARLLRDTGLLTAVEQGGETGLCAEAAAKKAGTSVYGAKVLLECGLSANIVDLVEGNYVLTTTGYFILHDELTSVNMNFIQDVCYKALFNLEESIQEGKPAGLKVFGDWKTVYEALASLPPQVKESWFNFDHFYSDSAFPEALRIVFEKKPRTLMDIGGNTGKWTLQCLKHSEDVHVTILDLPGQLEMAMSNFQKHALEHRVTPFPVDMLNSQASFPQGKDAVWMSQFLVCFSEGEIQHILERARESLAETGFLYILDTFWDRQKLDIAAFCLINSSPYFTAVANGNSKMYESSDFISLAQAAGLELVEQHDNLGLSHSLLVFKRR